MAFYVVDGHVRWVDNARAARVVADVVPIKTCDGDANGAPDKNPLSRQHDGVHEHVPHELATIREKKQARLVKRGRDIITGALYEIWDVDDGRGIYVDYYKSVMDSKAFPVDMSHLMVDGEELRSWPYDATGGKAIRDLGYEPVEDQR